MSKRIDPQSIGGGRNNEVMLSTHDPIAPGHIGHELEHSREIIDPLTAAFKAYITVVEILNQGRAESDHIAISEISEVEAELHDFLNEGRVAYIRGARERQPTSCWALVAKPNVLATGDEITNLAESFAVEQPYGRAQTSYFDENRYTPGQLSGTNPGNGKKISFELIPSKATPGLVGIVAKQRQLVTELQSQQPGVGVRVPSVLGAVTHWFTLRALGYDLSGGTNLQPMTYIRHVDLPTINGGVPLSAVQGGASQPCLDHSPEEYDYYGRVGLGEILSGDGISQINSAEGDRVDLRPLDSWGRLALHS